MSAIEPGEPITIKYGNGHTIKGVALSARQKRKIHQLITETKDLPKTQEAFVRLLDIAEEALRIAVPNITEEQLDTLDERQQLEIAGQSLVANYLTDEDRKKSESQP